MSQLTAGADGTSIQTDLLSSLEYYRDAGGNALKFVNRLYDDVLRHDPTPVELSAALKTLSLDRRLGRSDLAQEVVLSPEARAIRVDVAYHTLLNRYPNSAELASWVNRLSGSGPSAVPGTAMIAMIAASQAFYDHVGDTAAVFISKLYENLVHRPPGSIQVASDASLSAEISAGSAAARMSVANALVQSGEFRTDEITSFFNNYLHPTCGFIADQECTSGLVKPSASDLSTALTNLGAGSTEEDIIAGVLGSDQYYSNQGSTQAGFIQGVYEDLLGHPPTNAQASSALNNYTNDSIGHQKFAQSMVSSLSYQDIAVTLDYQQLLLRAPLASEQNAGQGVLAGDIKSLQTPDEILVETIAATPEYYVDSNATGGSDPDFVARTIDALLLRPSTSAEESTFLGRPAPHDAGWQAGVAETILDSTEYRTDFVDGVYEKYLSFSLCATPTTSSDNGPAMLVRVAAVLIVAVLLGAVIIALGVPAILRRRGTLQP